VIVYLFPLLVSDRVRSLQVRQLKVAFRQLVFLLPEELCPFEVQQQQLLAFPLQSASAGSL
jgi:hypothetical protein